MQEYFRHLENEVEKIYSRAHEARLLGLDPSLDVEITRATDVASRVEGLVGPRGVAEEIRSLIDSGYGREIVAFKIIEKIIAGKFGQFTPNQAAEQAIRTGVAIITESITAAPLEGISDVIIRRNPDGSRHLALYFASPIRAAGGTAAALSVLLADYIRQLLHLSAFSTTDEEIERYVEEVTLYGRIKHFQEPTSQQQIREVAKNLPVELNGEPTEKEEVSGYRNIRNVKTNNIRGGMCLVLNDGVIGRAPKILKIVERLGVRGWDWLRNLKKYAPTTVPSNAELKTDRNKVAPVLPGVNTIAPIVKSNPKFITDILGGRPIFAHPTTKGGFRLRYGRSRNTGLAGIGIHPATMYTLKEFLAPGTHILTERPGKGSIVTPVSTIQGPLVRLKDGSVVRIQDSDTAMKLKNQIELVIALGDLLVSFGEFTENNHPLVPSGYVEEWWIQEVRAAMRKRQLSRTFLASKLQIPLSELNSFFESPLTVCPSPNAAIMLSYLLRVPIHPQYTPEWSDISSADFIDLYNWIIESSTVSEEKITKIIGQDSQRIRLILEALEIPFLTEHNSLIIEEFADILTSVLRGNQLESNLASSQLPGDINVLELVNRLSSLEFRWKTPVRTGARMGRPEKANERRMKPPVHILYPIANYGGNSRSLTKAARKKEKLELQLANMRCPKCGQVTHYSKCPTCKIRTEIFYQCRDGHQSTSENCKCGLMGFSFSTRSINFAKEFHNALNTIDTSPRRVKGVKLLMSKNRRPEVLEKGILRAKHKITVFKDGTCRFDMTDAPLTHFKPKEIETPVKKLISLGYTVDIYGNPLVSEEQILELKVQDIIVNISALKFLERVARFVDDELRFLYKQEPHYNLTNYKDLIGHVVIGLAPHTSVGIIGRIIGITRASLSWAHPFWHAAKRRNCLAATEEIPIWDAQKKQLLVLPISKIVEDSISLGAKQKIVDSFGTIAIQNLYSHWQVISIDPNTRKPIFQPIKHWIKGQGSQWIQITTKKGRNIKITTDHQVLVWDEEEDSLKKTRASLLKPGDYIPVATQLNLPTQNPPSSINILQELAQNLPNIPKFHEFRMNVRLRNAEIWMKKKLLKFAQKLNESEENITPRKSTRIIRNYFSSKLPSEPYKNPFDYNWYSSIPLSHLQVLLQEGVFSWEEIPIDSFLGMARDDHTICPYITLNTEFMRLLGYFVSEGYIRDYTTCYQTNFSVPNPSLRSHIDSLIQQLLGSPPYYNKDNHQLVHTGRIHAYLFAYAWKIGTNALNKRIPSFIYTLPEEYRFNFLSALIDGDGTVGIRDNILILYTGNKNLAHDYCLLLSTFGLTIRINKL
ncbi:MAG: DNA polymerase II large subunit, partial [Promethearchaeota archaeon]